MKERLVFTVLPRLTSIDQGGFEVGLRQPLDNGMADQLRAIVNAGWLSADHVCRLLSRSRYRPAIASTAEPLLRRFLLHAVSRGGCLTETPCYR